jgi:hypothetical protein
MKASLNQKYRYCSTKKNRLVDALRKCDMRSEDYEAYHRCYLDTARESGKRVRAATVIISL